MIIIKSKREIELMKEPCKVTAELLNDLADFLGTSLGGGNLSVIDQSCDLVAEQSLSELGLFA